MMLHEFHTEYDNLSDARKKAALKKLFDRITSDLEQYDDYITAILEEAVMCEEDDYFGTEGLDV